MATEAQERRQLTFSIQRMLGSSPTAGAVDTIQKARAFKVAAEAASKATKGRVRLDQLRTAESNLRAFY